MWYHGGDRGERGTRMLNRTQIYIPPSRIGLLLRAAVGSLAAADSRTLTCKLCRVLRSEAFCGRHHDRHAIKTSISKDLSGNEVNFYGCPSTAIGVRHLDSGRMSVPARTAHFLADRTCCPFPWFITLRLNPTRTLWRIKCLGWALKN
jgi:hypothetical protein